MKKRLILLIIVLLLTGCKVEYKIDLDKNLTINESTKFIKTTKTDDELFKETSHWNIPLEKSNSYDFTKDKERDKSYYNSNVKEDSITYSYKYRNDDYGSYEESTFTNLAYEYISITNLNDNKFIISSSKEFLVFDRYHEIEEVKVTIHTDYKVLETNADEINNHNYTWLITPENAYGKNIYLEVDTSKEDLNFKERLLRGDYFNLFTISIIILVIAAIILFVLKLHSMRKNKI